MTATAHNTAHRPAIAVSHCRMSAVRLDRDGGSQPLRRHSVQGAMALQGLPGAFRTFQVSLDHLLQSLPVSLQ